MNNYNYKKISLGLAVLLSFQITAQEHAVAEEAKPHTQDAEEAYSQMLNDLSKEELLAYVALLNSKLQEQSFEDKKDVDEEIQPVPSIYGVSRLAFHSAILCFWLHYISKYIENKLFTTTVSKFNDEGEAIGTEIVTNEYGKTAVEFVKLVVLRNYLVDPITEELKKITSWITKQCTDVYETVFDKDVELYIQQ